MARRRRNALEVVKHIVFLVVAVVGIASLGEAAVLLAVMAACILLLLVLVEGIRRGNPVTVLVVGLFLMTFVRIGRDLVRVRGRGRKRGLG
jgi:hypothetical protein